MNWLISFLKATGDIKCLQIWPTCGTSCARPVMASRPLFVPHRKLLARWVFGKDLLTSSSGPSKSLIMVQMQLFWTNRHLTRLSPAALERIMQNARRPFRRASLLLAAVFCLALSATAAENARLKTLNHVIHATLNPKNHTLTPHAT